MEVIVLKFYVQKNDMFWNHLSLIVILNLFQDLSNFKNNQFLS